MQCPHCLVTIHAELRRQHIGDFGDGNWATEHLRCPACGRMVLWIINGTWIGGMQVVSTNTKLQVYPRGSGRPPVPVDVTDKMLIEDYTEACDVLPISAKASAALSRRCLQHILREKASVKKGDLSSEIQQVLDRKLLPSHLAESIDAVRNIGNFAAHPIKSTNTGEVLPVEPGEAEWNLDVLEGLFDFYYVHPAKLAAKRTALNQKLQEAGKPPVK